MKLDKKQILALVVLFLVNAVFFLPPLLHNGMFVSDDGDWMIIRFAAFYHALRMGQFPVRFLPQLNFGYGYPVANFLYPGFMYLGVPIKAVGLTFTSTVKFLFGLSFVSLGVFTFLWIKNRFSFSTAYLAVFIALLTPYYLYDIYTRGSLGEALAISLLPFILWMIDRKSVFWTGIGIFLLLLFHNTLALLFLPLILLYGLLARKMAIKSFLPSFFLGSLSASFFTIPAILELPLTQFAKTGVSNPLNYFAGITLIGWGALFILIAAFLKFILTKEKSRYSNIVILLLIVDALCIFIASPLSQVIWKIAPSSFVQFPFRFLSYLPITTAFLVSYLTESVKTKESRIFAGILFFLFLVFYSPLLLTHEYENQPDGYYATNEATTTVKDEYMPVWVRNKPEIHPATSVAFIKGSGTLENLVDTGNTVSFREIASTKNTLQLNTIYWPGWKASIDANPAAISYKNLQGVMQIIVPKGEHRVVFRFGETPLELFADILSVISLFGLLLYSFRKRLRK